MVAWSMDERESVVFVCLQSFWAPASNNSNLIEVSGLHAWYKRSWSRISSFKRSLGSLSFFMTSRYNGSAIMSSPSYARSFKTHFYCVVVLHVHHLRPHCVWLLPSREEVSIGLSPCTVMLRKLEANNLHPQMSTMKAHYQ